MKRRTQKAHKRRSTVAKGTIAGAKESRAVVDLGRAQRALAELTQILTEYPELRDRTARMLAGELPCGELEEKPSCPKSRKRRGLRNSR